MGKHHFADFSDLFGTSPAAITESAEQPRRHAHALRQLGDDLDRDGSLVSASVEGDIRDLGHAPAHGSRTAKRLGAHGLVAAACLERFGLAAQHFDTEVTRLNREWRTIHGGSPETPQEPTTGAVTPDDLERRYRRARHRLDQEARDSARFLDHPDSPHNIRLLMEEGLIPLSAVSHWPKLEKLIADEVNRGKITDPKIALSIDPSLYDAEGQKALAHWVKTHLDTVIGLLEDNQTVNLPPSPDGYSFKVTAVDNPRVKIQYVVTISKNEAVTSMTLSTSPGKLGLSGTVGSGDNSLSMSDGGWSAKAMVSNGDSKFGIDWDKDGPWFTSEHEHETPEGSVKSIVKVNPTGDDSPPPASDPAPVHVPNPFAPLDQLAASVKDGVGDAVGAVGSAAQQEGHHLVDGAKDWGAWLEEQGKGIGPALRDPDTWDVPTIPGPIPIPIVPFA